MVYHELPGGYVLTGGTMKMPGVLELAQDLFRSNVRIAIPDYIGVREPQFTGGVGILQFAYHNAKIQGKDLFPSVIVHTQEQKPKRTKNLKLLTCLSISLIKTSYWNACNFTY